MYTILVVLHVLVSIALIGLVLIQHGKGADAGAAFGSGASGTVFGARGAANFLTRITAWLAASFFGLSLALAYLVNGKVDGGSVVDALPASDALAPPALQLPTEAGAPAAPVEGGNISPEASGDAQKPAQPE